MYDLPREYAEGVTIAGHVPVSVKRDLVALAREHDRTISAEIRIAVVRHLEAQRAIAKSN